MDWLKIISIAVLSLYSTFILWNFFVLLLSKKDDADTRSAFPKMFVSIIIPTRNEEQTILTCLQSISKQDYPKDLIQVIVVDDHSTDNTSALAENFLNANFANYLLVKLTDTSGKKQAILEGVKAAKGNLIITRDADTFTNSDLWLKNIVSRFEKTDCDLLISSVILSANNSFLSTFQQFENLAITTLGAGMTKSKLPFVCSGANLAYKKDVFLKLAPYKDNLDVASGDDMFLLKHFYKNECMIGANTSAQAIVYTSAENSLSDWLSQRLRWASKTGKINTLPVSSIGLLVLFMNTLAPILLISGAINGCYLSFSLFTLTLKFIIDFLLLFLSARMYKQKVNWLWFPPAFLFNGLYVPAVAFASFFVKPIWKSRKL